MYREVGDIMEDISADGLGNGPFRVDQLPGRLPRVHGRDPAARARAARRPPLGLYLNASYTWSRLEGNWDIDYADRSSTTPPSSRTARAC